MISIYKSYNNLLVLILTITTLPTLVQSHSYLLNPHGDFLDFNKAECRVGGPITAVNDDCPGPCISSDSWQYNPFAQVFTYYRGQTVPMIWAKNQHQGGFIRFSLVPLSQRMNHTAHRFHAFKYSCYESNEHICMQQHCGTDSLAYSTNVIIPNSIPDGDYTLSWTWFGGTQAGHSNFGDYFTCVPVRIQGGDYVEDLVKPVFEPGENLPQHRYAAITDACLSGTDDVGVCWQEPCLGLPELPMVPKAIQEIRVTETNTQDGQATELLGPSSMEYVHVTKLSLYDTNTGMPTVDGIEDHAVIPVGHNFNSLTLVAETDGPVIQVAFYINGIYIRTEKQAPFSCWGDQDGVFTSWPHAIMFDLVQVMVIASAESGASDSRVFKFTLVR